MISIVLPSYNGERYIEQAVDSIIHQTYKNWELIIVDDCSTDNTMAIAETYSSQDPRIRVIHNEVNQKLPSSLNIGFEHAKGDLFTWTSDDNALKPEALERMRDQLVKDDKIDFIYANYTIIDPDDYILYEVETGPNENIYLSDIIGACFLYKREIHEKLGGYIKEKFLVEDYDFWLRAYRYYKFYHLDDNLYYYRVHNSSLTAERQDMIQQSTVKLLEENYLYIPSDKVDIRASVNKKIRNYYSKQKRYFKAIKYYLMNVKGL